MKSLTDSRFRLSEMTAPYGCLSQIIPYTPQFPVKYSFAACRQVLARIRSTRLLNTGWTDAAVSSIHTTYIWLFSAIFGRVFKCGDTQFQDPAQTWQVTCTNAMTKEIAKLPLRLGVAKMSHFSK